MQNINSDRSTKKWLSGVVILQMVILLTLWGSGPSTSTAMGDIPDAGAQRVQIIDQMKSTNDKLDKLITLLSHGDLQVKIAKTDDSR